VRRWAVVLAIVGCDQPTDGHGVSSPRAWVYPPALAAWPLGEQTGSIGRSQPPQVALAEGIAGPGDERLSPLRLPTPWPVPGDGLARAVVYGVVDGRHAIELVDIDAGRIAWRDTTACAAPVVGVTSEAVVCADARGTRAVSLDGAARWNSDGATFIAMTGERVAIAGVGESVIVDAATGGELARVKLPAGIPSDAIVASCGDAGRELFAFGQDGKLARIAEGQGGPRVAWSVPLPGVTAIEQLDACEGASVLVAASTSAGTTLLALARDTGVQTGAITGVRGHWPARDGSERVEVSTATSVARWSRALDASEHVDLSVLGELLARRGAQRLVRATPLTAVMLDAAGVRAYLPLAQQGAVLGERAIIAASWLGSPGETVRRVGVPAAYRRALRISPPRPAVTVIAELRDLPPIREVALANAIRSEAGRHAVGPSALDDREPHALYVAARDRAPDEDVPGSIARFDLRSRAWSWSRADGCAAGTPVGLALARELVACAVRGARASVRATGRDGHPLWEWTGDNVDGVQAAGDLVLVHDADRALALDARDGRVLARFASDDGAALRAAVIDIEGMTLLVTAERDRVVGRLPRVNLMPAWSLAIEGTVASIAAAGDGALVALEDGDAYRIDGRTGVPAAVAGLDLVWRASGELVTGEAPGGPIPPETPHVQPAAPVVAPPVKRPARRRAPVPERDPDAPPRLPTPWPPPPPLRASWQVTLYELTGGLRARNDYALEEPITPARTRAAGAPIVVESGPEQRDVLVVEPERGDPVRRARMPEDAVPGLAFSTVIDGQPVVGTLLANPLRVVLF
jgi:hypothetical protein